MGTQGDNFRVVAGRYRLEVRLGRGGMGVVWRATDLLLGRRVAVKELSLDETLSEGEARWQRDRTLREARAVAQLRHPHIIVVHDVVEQDERFYLVMELIDGGSLADRIAGYGPVGAAEAARIGADLLSALRAAHAAGVLHRDIKPANVLLEAGTGRVVLTDFGVAQVAGATTLTETGSFVGSPEYTAPERMTGAGTGPASDLWSVGALLCTALSGDSPFRRDSLSGVLHAVLSAEIRPPAQAAPLLPVVRGLLERDPERRLDAEAAERMLRTFLETGHLPVAGKHSLRGVLTAVVLVAAMAGAGVSGAALLLHDKGGGGPAPSPSPSVSTSATASATSKSATPKSVTPKSATSKSVTPRSATSKSVTPRSATPKSVTPRSATSKKPSSSSLSVSPSASFPAPALTNRR
ncbi:serine/threonine protein kinase [Streptomyces sp. Act143]|nr:serine/threonine protein kinase [Streptomyces sp. Act143]